METENGRACVAICDLFERYDAYSPDCDTVALHIKGMAKCDAFTFANIVALRDLLNEAIAEATPDIKQDSDAAGGILIWCLISFAGLVTAAMLWAGWYTWPR